MTPRLGVWAIKMTVALLTVIQNGVSGDRAGRKIRNSVLAKLLGSHSGGATGELDAHSQNRCVEREL